MSASERLRKLGEGNHDAMRTLGASLLVLDALPEIIAVVEAAENADEMMFEESPDPEVFGLRMAALGKSLSALEEKLGAA